MRTKLLCGRARRMPSFPLQRISRNENVDLVEARSPEQAHWFSRQKMNDREVIKNRQYAPAAKAPARTVAPCSIYEGAQN